MRVVWKTRDARCDFEEGLLARSRVRKLDWLARAHESSKTRLSSPPHLCHRSSTTCIQHTHTHTQVIMSSPPSSALSPTSPRRGSLGRRASNPFTRNQDLAEEGGAAPDASSMISSFRNASLGRRSSSSHEQTIDEGGSDEDLEPAVIQPPQSSALGAGTGVSAPASATTPAGLPLAPSLDPAGGSQRQVRPGLVSTSSEAYSSSNEAPAAAKTESAPRGTGRSRGIVRTYSMVRS